jgi:hypothetical protein
VVRLHRRDLWEAAAGMEFGGTAESIADGEAQERGADFGGCVAGRERGRHDCDGKKGGLMRRCGALCMLGGVVHGHAHECHTRGDGCRER